MLVTVSKYLIACSRSGSWEETSEMKLVLVSVAGVVWRGDRDDKLEYYEMRPSHAIDKMRPFPMPVF